MISSLCGGRRAQVDGMAARTDLLSMALERFRASQFREAERLCREVLQTEPRHAGALHLLGTLALQAGRPQDALACLDQALAIDPTNALAHCRRAQACQALGRPAEALAGYHEALHARHDIDTAFERLAESLRPAEPTTGTEDAGALSAAAHNDRGVALARQGRLDEAVACFRRALELRPSHGSARGNLGLVLAKQGRLAEAVACYEQALCFEPDTAETHVNLGNALRDQGKLDAAVARFRRATQIRPDLVEAYLALGQLHARLGRPADAEECYRQGLLARQGNPALLIGLANLLQRHSRLDEAATAAEEAVRTDPTSAEGFNVLGVIEVQRGRTDEALAHFDRALELRPGLANAHLNRAMIWLMQGDFERGWAEYEWRWRGEGYPPRPFRQPGWDGSPLAGRTILLHAEMGFGDTIMFVRYAALVKRRGGRVLVEAPAALLRLLRGCPGIDGLVARGEQPPAFDVHAPLMSLPLLFRTTLDTVPAEIPYLSAEPELVQHWGRELPAGPGLRVGIAWQGSITAAGGHLRAIPLRCFAPLGKLEGVRLFSLQKGAGAEQLREVAGLFPITELGSRLDEQTGAFVDTAAVMMNLDLVVTSDTSIGHLAGALGVRVWVASGYPAEFRWMLEGENSPWYPTLRLFRREAGRGWEPLFEKIAAELAKLAKARGSA
jgi:tetratricopeptide (TPR) repeat protein